MKKIKLFLFCLFFSVTAFMMSDIASYTKDAQAATITKTSSKNDNLDAKITSFNTYKESVSLTELKELTTKSPDKAYKIQVYKDENNSFYYSVTCNNFEVIKPSAIGMKLQEADLTAGLNTKGKSATKEINETYKANSLSASKAVNHCNERRISFTKDNASFDLVFRAYNDGFAFRYEDVKVGSSDKLTVLSEMSEYVLPTDALTWSFGLNGTYEGNYERRTYAQTLANPWKISTPLLASVGDYKVLISEARVFNNNGDYCKSALKGNTASRSLRWTFGLDRDPNKEVTNDWDSPGHIDIKTVTTRNGFSTPWRAAIISNDYNKYLTSTLISNLNPKPDSKLFADTKWIKPGKVAWSWWSEGLDQGNYGLHIKYIDFAAKNGWEYVCLDSGWEKFENRLKEICDYGKSKKVGLFFWFNYRALKDPQKTDEIFAKLSKAGAVGLKLDYFESDAQPVLETYEQIAKIAAKHKLMVLYHGCLCPCGEYRTYPNILSMEAVQGEEYRKWSDTPKAEACMMYAFTRNVLGSMDYTPAIAKIAKVPETWGYSIAKSVVFNSALQHFSNSVNVYKTYIGLPFLNNVSTSWDKSLVLEANVGNYITYARNKGKNWFIGSMTLNPRTMKVKLNFLGKGKYNAYIYKDNEDGSKLVLEKKVVTKKDTISMDLLKYGGTAIMLTKSKINTTVDGLAAEDSTQGNKNEAGYNFYEAESPENTISGDAKVANVDACSGGSVVGYVGNGENNYIQFNKINVDKDGTYEVKLYYCTQESRDVTVTVNNGEKVDLPGLTGDSWTEPSETVFKVTLKKGTNVIKISNDFSFTPDIDRIAVSKKNLKN